MRARNRLLIAAAGLALLGTAAWIASGDAPERVSGGGVGVAWNSKAPKPTAHQLTRSTTLQAGAFDPFCIKCDGGMSAPLTDDDIRAAGDAAEILVMGLSEPHGHVEPVWDGWTPASYTVPDVPLAAMPSRSHPWPVNPSRDTPWLYIPGRPVSPVPEPGAWATMLVGLGAVGMMLRRKHDRR